MSKDTQLRRTAAGVEAKSPPSLVIVQSPLLSIDPQVGAPCDPWGELLRMIVTVVFISRIGGLLKDSLLAFNLYSFFPHP